MNRTSDDSDAISPPPSKNMKKQPCHAMQKNQLSQTLRKFIPVISVVTAEQKRLAQEKMLKGKLTAQMTKMVEYSNQHKSSPSYSDKLCPRVSAKNSPVLAICSSYYCALHCPLLTVLQMPANNNEKLCWYD
jgi:hypothetical protein